MRLNVTDFEVGPERDCSVHLHYLEVRNGGSATSPLVGKFCGNGTASVPPALVSHGHQLLLRFASDVNPSGRGFRLLWSTPAGGCGGVLTAPEDSLTSPGYPAAYGDDAECFWRIQVAQGSQVRFVFSDLHMEQQGSSCNFDYVQVSFGTFVARDSSTVETRLQNEINENSSKAIVPGPILEHFFTEGSSKSQNRRQENS